MFFTYLDQVMSPGVDYHLTISKTTSGKLAVSVLPKVNDLKDPAQHHIVPLNLTGTPGELDHGFFPAVTTPIRKASCLLVDMAGYEKQLEKAAKESKSAKDTKAAEGKGAKDEKEKLSKEEKAKRDKYDGYIKRADEMESAGNFDGAILQLQQARLHATDEAMKTVDEKIAALKVNMGQGSLFEVAPVPASAQAPAPAPAPAAPQVPVPSAVEVVSAPNPAAAPTPEPIPDRQPSTDAATPTSAPDNDNGNGNGNDNGNGQAAYHSTMTAPVSPNGQGFGIFSPAAPESQAHTPAPVAGNAANGNGGQTPPAEMSGGRAAERGIPVYQEYDSAPRPADSRYPSHREGEYAEYPDFIPPAGGGMGAPVFAGM